MGNIGKVIVLAAALGAVYAMGGGTVGTALAQNSWVDEITTSLTFYQTNYPAAGWESYNQRLAIVKGAVARGDSPTIRKEMGKWFKMLRAREHGIQDVAADELFNFSLMVTPIQEYGISVPAQSGAGGEFGY